MRWTPLARLTLAIAGGLVPLTARDATAQPATTTSTRPTSRPFRLTVAFVANWSDDRFDTPRGHEIVENILTWQNENGGWWKGYDLTAAKSATRPTSEPTTGPRAEEVQRWHVVSTIDNGATYCEMRILAHAYRLWKHPEYRAAFDRGLNFLLSMQYPNGGFPQRFPLQHDYGSHITFNDDAMANVLRLLHEVALGEDDFTFVDAPTRARARDAFDRGIECILKCQIKVDGRLTGWCAQHDEVTFAPAAARTYELPSISGSESVAVTLLLMDVPKPDDRVKQAVRGAVEWFERSKIVGKRMRSVRDETVPGGRDRRIVDDPEAPAQWARFYDLETNRPFYCGRDGVKKWSLAEIDADRRNNYQWMRPWAQPVFDRYPKWAAENGLPTTLPAATTSPR
jgi:PelA/Pel-15E family pectate lyase